MSQFSARKCKGISLLEVLIGASVLVVLLAYFTPTIGRQEGKAELKQAVERVEKAISHAQQTARLTHSNVIMKIMPGNESGMDSITLTVPARNEPTPTEPIFEVIEFPEGVSLVSERPEIHFDFRGEVDQPTQLLVVSNITEDLDKRVLIY